MENTIPKEKIEVLSSIPGRIRVKIMGFKNVDFFKEKIINSLAIKKEIDSIRVNDRINTILIFYNTDLTDDDNIISLISQIDLYKEIINLNICESKNALRKMIFKAFNPFNLLKKHYDKNIYSNQYNVAKSLVKTTIGISVFSLLYSYKVRTILSILILGYPGFLFVISSTAYYLSHKIAFKNNVFSKNIHSFKKISDSDSIAIDSNLLLNDNNENNYSVKKSDTYDLPKYKDFYSFNKIKSMVNHNISTVIRDLRNLGVINLKILCKKVDYLLEKVLYTLELEPLPYSNQNANEFKGKSYNTFIVKYKSIYPLNEIYNNIMVFAYDNTHSFIDSQPQNIFVHEENITKIPFLIHLTRHIDETIIQIQAIAITINILGMLLAIYGFISIPGCIILYLCNLLFSSILLRIRTYMDINKKAPE